MQKKALQKKGKKQLTMPPKPIEHLGYNYADYGVHNYLMGTYLILLLPRNPGNVCVQEIRVVAHGEWPHPMLQAMVAGDLESRQSSTRNWLDLVDRVHRWKRTPTRLYGVYERGGHTYPCAVYGPIGGRHENPRFEALLKARAERRSCFCYHSRHPYS